MTTSSTFFSRLFVDSEQIVEDDRDEGDRDAQEDERSEHEREASVDVNRDDDNASVENDGVEGDDGAEGQRDEGLLYRFGNMSLDESDQIQRNELPETAQQVNSKKIYEMNIHLFFLYNLSIY